MTAKHAIAQLVEAEDYLRDHKPRIFAGQFGRLELMLARAALEIEEIASETGARLSQAKRYLSENPNAWPRTVQNHAQRSIKYADEYQARHAHKC